MKKLVALLFVGIAVLVVLLSKPSHKSVTSRALPNTAELAIVHSSNRMGTLEPCGCQVNPYGGIDREANAVAQLRKVRPNLLFVDGGNLLNGGEATLEQNEKEDRAKVMVEMLNISGLNLFTPGPLDYDLGALHLRRLQKSAHFPFISTNVRMASGGETVFKPYSIFEIGGVRYGVVSASDPAAISAVGVTVDSPDKTLAKWIPTVKKHADIIILVSQLPNLASRDLAVKYGIPIVIGAEKSFGTDHAVLYQHGQHILVDTQIQGFLLGLLDIDFRFPFNGFTSDEEVERNRKSLAYLKKTQANSAHTHQFEESRLLSPIAGGSSYYSELIKLDEERFGAPNEVSALKERYYQSLRKTAVAE
ncbi:MAG: hypothetical protein KDD51_17085 [Bdellovibrionales bacterium]|nr:hypothetical protein [Bdellovibrionales bacterium]